MEEKRRSRNKENRKRHNKMVREGTWWAGTILTASFGSFLAKQTTPSIKPAAKLLLSSYQLTRHTGSVTKQVSYCYYKDYRKQTPNVTKAGNERIKCLCCCYCCCCRCCCYCCRCCCCCCCC